MIQVAEDNKSSSKLIFVDFVANKAYSHNGEQLAKELEDAVLEITSRKKTIAKIDDEEIKRLDQKRSNIKTRIESNNGTF